MQNGIRSGRGKYALIAMAAFTTAIAIVTQGGLLLGTAPQDISGNNALIAGRNAIQGEKAATLDQNVTEYLPVESATAIADNSSTAGLSGTAAVPAAPAMGTGYLSAGFSLGANLTPNVNSVDNSVLTNGVIKYRTLAYSEYIPFEQKTVQDSTLKKGSRKTVSKGEQGVKNFYISYVLTSSGETKRVLTEEVEKKPVDMVTAIGTRTTSSIITGVLSMPLYGDISSRFGMRWGKLHTGIDIVADIGTPVRSADGGTVVFAGIGEGGYGKFVMIGHGNGIRTCYGHLSKILVKEGQKVAKGDKIALSGNTGNSTGPHLHFEVRKNDSPVNPFKYLK